MSKTVTQFIFTAIACCGMLLGMPDIGSATQLTNVGDSWQRESNPTGSFNGDLISVWNTASLDVNTSRIGLVEFDLSALASPITEAHFQLWSENNGFSDDPKSIKQSAVLLDPDDLFGITSGNTATWDQVQSAIGAAGATTLSTLGAYDLTGPFTKGLFYSSDANTSDVAALEAIRLGSTNKRAYIVLIAAEDGNGTPGTGPEYATSWSDGELGGNDATLFINETFVVPLVPSFLQMRINRYSGNTRIRVAAGGEETLAWDGYSASVTEVNATAWDHAGWNSLTEQAKPGWEEVNATSPATPDQLITELNFDGNLSMGPGAEVNLGNAYKIAEGQQTLLFQYTLAGDATEKTGAVVYDGEGLRLRVNKSTGKIEILNVESVGVAFDGYIISSPGSDLNATSWSSLTDQNVTGWAEASPSDGNLSELRLVGSSTLAGGALFDLAGAYAGTPSSPNDLTFDWHSVTDGNVTISALIEYIVAGDMDGNGVVDLNDTSLLVLALVNRAAYDALGHTNPDGFLIDADITGNVDGSATGFDLGDLAAFSALLGGPASASASAVPEPSTLMLLGIAAVGLLGRRRTRTVAAR